MWDTLRSLGFGTGVSTCTTLSLRILIADDNASVLDAICRLLEGHAGWQVCAKAMNGAEAVVKAAEMRPDLIVLDMAMPEMNGLNAARAILKTNPAVPIVIYTLYDSAELRRAALEAGIRDVVPKAQSADLLSRLEQALAQSGRQEPPLGHPEVSVGTLNGDAPSAPAPRTQPPPGSAPPTSDGKP